VVFCEENNQKERNSMKMKKITSLILTMSLLVNLAAVGAVVTPPVSVQAQGELPEAAFLWDFENVQGTDAGNGATLEDGASIKTDAEKGKVLNLPGGSLNAGSMTLPQSMFENLGTAGFTISMWVKASSATGNYTKFFNASNGPLGASYDGGNSCHLLTLPLRQAAAFTT